MQEIYKGFHMQMLTADGNAIEFYIRNGFERATQTEPGSTLLIGAILFILATGLGAEEAMVVTLMLLALSLVFSIPTLIIYILLLNGLKKHSRINTK
ncbi:hypothetical protein [Sphingobacterium sp. 2149]|uniref:hypothetical protein n=1 Tax=Sphingobacterium sp. 2149 TaxID=2817763 RepID=UPI00286AF306|nr:hypothetical protein [Sphingobacterium sp. 2149]